MGRPATLSGRHWALPLRQALNPPVKALAPVPGPAPRSPAAPVTWKTESSTRVIDPGNFDCYYSHWQAGKVQKPRRVRNVTRTAGSLTPTPSKQPIGPNVLLKGSGNHTQTSSLATSPLAILDRVRDTILLK
ncbi:hypothetical protein EHS25_001671 [Saitozyma podzolica]|uniref:Uncharacterized protein n=1 Tax=Saitozyma podzolica TaxID=1890683 RepID=A0A427YH33_9TREE|nr:hypothetical protein EHS25_001671 [Saitozyma podzolica]